MKLIRVCFFGRYSVRGFFIAANVHFSLSPIPRIHLWLDHYSRLSSAVPERGTSAVSEGVWCCSRAGGPVLLQRGSSAAPERRGQCSFRGGLVLLQREGQYSFRGGAVLPQSEFQC